MLGVLVALALCLPSAADEKESTVQIQAFRFKVPGNPSVTSRPGIALVTLKEPPLVLLSWQYGSISSMANPMIAGVRVDGDSPFSIAKAHAEKAKLDLFAKVIRSDKPRSVRLRKGKAIVATIVGLLQKDSSLPKTARVLSGVKPDEEPNDSEEDRGSEVLDEKTPVRVLLFVLQAEGASTTDVAGFAISEEAYKKHKKVITKIVNSLSL